MKTKHVIAIYNSLSLLLRDKACSGLTAYRAHRAVADLEQIVERVNQAREKAVEAERNGHDEKAVAEIRQRIWEKILETDENVTVPKLSAAGIDWGKGDPGALQELIRQELTEGEPAS
jgi:hypothetical protein